MCAKYLPIFTASSAAQHFYAQFHCSKFVLNIHQQRPPQIEILLATTFVGINFAMGINSGDFTKICRCSPSSLHWSKAMMMMMRDVKRSLGASKGAPWGSKGPMGFTTWGLGVLKIGWSHGGDNDERIFLLLNSRNVQIYSIDLVGQDSVIHMQCRQKRWKAWMNLSGFSPLHSSVIHMQCRQKMWKRFHTDMASS